MDAPGEGCLWEEIDACGDRGWLTRREGCSWGRRDACEDRGMLLAVAAHGKESGTLRHLEILPAWSEDNEPGLAKLLRGVNSFVGPNRAGYGRMLWEKP